jgi:hypothetical protein
MITTIIYPDPNSWQQYKYRGLAKNLDVAREILTLAGWELTNNWGYEIEEHHWVDADFFHPYDEKELYVLGICLLMN